MAARQPAAPTELAGQAWPSPQAPPAPGARAWIALAVLCGVYILNFLDRSLLAILAKPIQDTLHITDGQLGLIGGLYFAFFYCFIAIPIGWLADRTNRVNVLTVACAIWSVATACCGLALRYPQLVVARMLVGVGEAGGVPPSYALITDYFPPGRRGKAFGIYNLGPPIGAALGIAFGAAIAAAFNWRVAFVALGGVGIVVAVAVRVILREPPRGGLDAGPVRVMEHHARFFETVAMFFSRPALVVGIVMSAGMLVSGQMVDRLTDRAKSAYATLPAAALALAIPFYLGFVW